MKRFILSVLVLVGVLSAAAQAASIGNLSDNSPVGKYEKFEAAFDLGKTYDNPFDPAEIDVTAEFTSPTGKVKKVVGFYFQDYARNGDYDAESLSPLGPPVWKARFAPEETGRWTYRLSAVDAAGTVRSEPRTFQVRESANRGFIRISKKDPEYFAFDNGEPFFAVGENLGWALEGATYRYDAWVGGLSGVGANFFRMWQAPWGTEFEWADRYSPSTRLPGNYLDRMKQAWQLDHILDLSERKGVYVMLCLLNHGRFSSKTDSNWNQNPFNRAANPARGFLDEPQQFWTDPTARKFIQRNWRYLIARYAHHTSLHSWEIFNEMEWTDQYDKKIKESAAFHKTLGAFLKAQDPYGRLVTTSYADALKWPADVWNAGMDFTQNHHYGGADTAQIVEGFASEMLKRHPGKPFWMGEKGLGTTTGIDAKLDPTGISIHDGNWASLTAKAAGGAFPWWFDEYIHPNNLYWRWKGIARFVEGEDLDARGYRPVAFEVSSPLAGELLVSPGNASWGVRASEKDFTLSPDGSISPSPANLTTFMYSSEKADFKNPPTFHLEMAQPGKFKVMLGGVSDWGPNLLTIQVDGKPSAVNNTPVTAGGTYEVELPAGRHDVFVDSTGKDWFQVSAYSVTPFAGALRCRALNGTDRVLGRVQSRFYTYASRETPEVKGATLHLAGLSADGAWKIEWWDTHEGKRTGTDKVEVSGGKADVALPPVSKDMAFKLSREGGMALPAFAPRPTIPPDPSPTPAPRLNRRGDMALYHFEDGTLMGWNLDKGSTANTNLKAFKGLRSLALKLDLGPGEEAMAHVPNRPLLMKGNRYTLKVYAPAGADLEGKIFFQDTAWTWKDGGPVKLVPGKWNAFAWEIPPEGWKNPCKRVGLHLKANGAFQGTVFVDSADFKTEPVPKK